MYFLLLWLKGGLWDLIVSVPDSSVSIFLTLSAVPPPLLYASNRSLSKVSAVKLRCPLYPTLPTSLDLEGGGRYVG